MLQMGLRAHDYGQNLKPEDLADILVEYKPASIQLALRKVFSSAPKIGALSSGYARRIKRIFEERNIGIAVLGCYINPIHPDANVREIHLRNFEEHLRFAHDFGCSIVGTETGSCNGDCSFHPDTEKEVSFNLFCRSLERLISTAEKCGSIVAIEAVADQHTISSIEKMGRVLRKFSSPALKVIYDPVNLIPNSGLNENQEDFFMRAFNVFGDDIVAIHAKDFRMEGNKKSGALCAGTGDLDYSSLLKIIMDRKPYIDILLENSSPETWETACQYLSDPPVRIVKRDSRYMA